MKQFIKHFPEDRYPWKVYYIKDGIGYQHYGSKTYKEARSAMLQPHSQELLYFQHETLMRLEDKSHRIINP